MTDTTITQPSASDRSHATLPRGFVERFKWGTSDSFTVTRRNLLRFVRIPALFVFSIVQPIMFVLLFRYVFGGNITNLPAGVSYVNYLLPGIFVQTSIFGSTQTGIGLSEDLKSGVIDRFKSLPMARSAVLTGRTFSDLVRNTVVVGLMIAVGYLVGFSFQEGLAASLAAIALAIVIGYAFSWVSATIGLAIKNTESVQAASFTWIFPLTFISSALVPIQGMPAALQFVARNNPVTYWSNAVRILTVGYENVIPPGGESFTSIIIKCILWLVAIFAVFVPLSVKMYRDNT